MTPDHFSYERADKLTPEKIEGSTFQVRKLTKVTREKLRKVIIILGGFELSAKHTPVRALILLVFFAEGYLA